MTTNSPHIHRQEAVKWEGPSTSTSGGFATSGGTNGLHGGCTEQTGSQQVIYASNVTTETNAVRNGGYPKDRAGLPETQPEMDISRNVRQNLEGCHMQVMHASNVTSQENAVHNARSPIDMTRIPEMQPEMDISRNIRQNVDGFHLRVTTEERSAKQSLEKLRQMRQRLHSDEDLKPNSYTVERSKHPRTLSDGANYRQNRPQPLGIVHGMHRVGTEGQPMHSRSPEGPISPPNIANLGDVRFFSEKGPMSPKLLHLNPTSFLRETNVNSEPSSRSSTPIWVDTPPVSASASPVTVLPGYSEGATQGDSTTGENMSYRNLWKNRSMRKKVTSNQDSKPSQEKGSRKVFKRGDSSPSLLAGTVSTEKLPLTQDKQKETERTTQVEQSEKHTISEHLDTGAPAFRRSAEGSSSRRSLRLKYPKAMQQIPSFSEFRRMQKDGHVSPSSKFTTNLTVPMEENEECVAKWVDNTSAVSKEKESERRAILEHESKRNGAGSAFYVSPNVSRKESSCTRESAEVARSVPQDASQSMPVSSCSKSEKHEEKSILSILSTYYAKEGKRSDEICNEKGATSQEVLRTRHTNQQMHDVSSERTDQNPATVCYKSDALSDIVEKELLANHPGHSHGKTNSHTLLQNIPVEEVRRQKGNEIVPRLDLDFVNKESVAHNHSVSPRTEDKTPGKGVCRHINVVGNGEHSLPRDSQGRYVDFSKGLSEVLLDTKALIKIAECNVSPETGQVTIQERRFTSRNAAEDDLRAASASQTRLQQAQMLQGDHSDTVEAVNSTVRQPFCKHVNNKHNLSGPLETKIPSSMSEMSPVYSTEHQTLPKTCVEPSNLRQTHEHRTYGYDLQALHNNAESKRLATSVVPSAKQVHCPRVKESSPVQELGHESSATTEPTNSCFEKVESDTLGTNFASPDDNSPNRVGGMSLVTVEWTLRRNKGCLVEAVNSNEDTATPYVSAVDQLKSKTRPESPSGKLSPRSWYSRHWSAPITPKPMLENNLAVTTSVASNDSSPASTPRAKRKIFDICKAASEKLQETESAKGSTEMMQEQRLGCDLEKNQCTADTNSHSQETSQSNLLHKKVETKATCESLMQPGRGQTIPPSKREDKTERKDETACQRNKPDKEAVTVIDTGNDIHVESHANSVIIKTGSTVEVNSGKDKLENGKGNMLDGEGLTMWGSLDDDDTGSRNNSRRGSGESSPSDSSEDDTQVSMPEIQLVFQDSPVHVGKESSQVLDLSALGKLEVDEHNHQETLLGVGEKASCDDTEGKKRQGMCLSKSWNSEMEEWIGLDSVFNDQSAAKNKKGDKQSSPSHRSNSYRKRGLERQKPVSSTSEELFARKYKNERKNSTGNAVPAEKGKTPKRSVTWHALVRTSDTKTEARQKPQSSVARSTSDVTNSSSRDSHQDKTPRPVRQHNSDPTSMAMHRTRNWLHRHHGMEDLTIVEGVASDVNDKRASRTKSKNRHSNVSTASVDSGVIALDDERSIMEARPSAVDIARNDSGVGMETTRVPRKTRETTDESNCADCERVNTVIDVEEEEESPRCYRTEDTLLCPRCEKRRVERKEAIQELVQTELSYGTDLRVIKEEFYEPIEKAGLLTPQQLQTIFINILELIEVNDRFADKLQDAIEHAQEQGDEDYIYVNIGRIFLEAANMLLAFETYCTKQPAAPAMLKTLESEKDLFRIFLEVSQTDNSALRRMHLSSFLMAPLQRITKYPLLLSRLYKSTSCRHTDRDRLLEAQQLVEEHLEHINIKTQGSSGLMRLKKKSSRKSTSSVENIELREMAVDAVSWNKDEVHFVHMGKLQVVQCGDTWTKKTKVSSVHALLLVLGQMPNVQALEENRQPAGDKTVKGAALVLIREKGAGRFTPLREPFFLDKCVVSSDLDTEEAFEITEICKDPYILRGEDPADTSRWLALLQNLARDLGNWRRRRNALANIMIHMVSRT